MTDLGRWEPYPLDMVAEIMRDSACTWWLSGGCAIDVIAQRVVREHGDTDISVRRADWPVFATETADRLECFFARGGVLAPATLAPDAHNIWAREPGGSAWRLQVNLEPVLDGEWRYRRDECVCLPLDAAVDTTGAIPCVRAAVQLLWKSKAPRPVDELDFDAVIRTLTAEERAWLAASIAHAHPDSPWLPRFV